MSWHRDEATVSVGVEPPSRFPVMWRLECACGCGAWFYAARQRRGRKPMYLNRDHANWARNRRRSARGQEFLTEIRYRPILPAEVK